MTGPDRQRVTVVQACEGMLIPSGQRVVIPEGMDGWVTQRLGTSITFQAATGHLLRVDAKDAPALGLPPAGEGEGAAAASDAPFEPERVWAALRTVYDPEIPVDVVELGLVYGARWAPLPEGGHRVEVEMTVTAPGCGMGQVLQDEVRQKLLALPGVREAEVRLVWEPPWEPARMSDAARLLLGWL
jgi:probable FeS assembly SUF system protein SufT